MKTLKQFQEHYGYPDVEEAKAEYQRYLDALEVFKRIDEKRESREDPEEKGENNS